MGLFRRKTDDTDSESPKSILQKATGLFSKTNSSKQQKNKSSNRYQPPSGPPPQYSAPKNSRDFDDASDDKKRNLYCGGEPGDTGGANDSQNQDPPTDPFDVPTTEVINNQGGVRKNDAFAALAAYDIVLLLDDSDSMELTLDGKDASGGQKTRWDHLAMVVYQIAGRIIPYDTDGIDIYFLKYKTADGNVKFNITEAVRVWKLFETVKPTGPGGTPTDDKVRAITKAYLETYKQYLLGNISTIKPMNIICITDGEPNDYINLTDIIKLTAMKLKALEDEHRAKIGNRELRQLGIQFVQVGSDDAATKFLRKLDTEFEKTPGNPYDIVDVFDYQQWLKDPSSGSTLRAEDLVKLLMGAIDPKWDTADEE
ncbi:hypothetical protein FPQ18DRAFT_316536 [Pyronema domesticum]|uniref:VWFA domain-containing protein n=1 Tax=Pyronema omphalodes (strain CBS 100304) TaxID=1076935 RepID=U4LDG8_PYROM|nr:hypothetical protein FPQ18DRAFT_316536 [Pyronema domesticum]CCX08762.1 Similar to hypothetical protein PGTG_11634 [Puccinia graminis f. sp. tritici CRL 75-36-700-3]; acc. no. XP_003330297 [Pyronema omphalodes CBS 100304]